ncbi:MAG: T9SS type A sorting domain-containing protein [Bacteroidia bacterium]|nr:T9SS type A sorting domain-containing protein [Bacteroidia bacterium]
MKTILLAVCGLLLVTYTNAQSLDRSVVSTSGGEMSSSSTTLEYTIGETIVGDMSASGTMLTNGFNQAQKEPGVGIENIIARLGLSIYPNPATDRLTIESEENLNVSVLDCLGKEVLPVRNVNANTQEVLQVDQLPAGVYFLRIQNENDQTMVKWIKA